MTAVPQLIGDLTRRGFIGKVGRLGMYLVAGTGALAALGASTGKALAMACGFSCISMCVCVGPNQTATTCCQGEDLECGAVLCCCDITCGPNCSGCTRASYKSNMGACVCVRC